jgi:hypothetical protein
MYGLYLSVWCWGGDYLRCCCHGRLDFVSGMVGTCAYCAYLLGGSGRLIVVADRVRQAELVMPIVRPEWKYVKFICHLEA